ncbi:MAG: hypothetical protein KDC03_21740, partial [Flavobacteriales bacterium]|nr:hypothetical protein [Flavobacteriales bacterium]
MASDYHDYVIRDGQFIGAFEEMYRNVADPWHQSSQPNPYSRMAGILHIQRTGFARHGLRRFRSGGAPKSAALSPRT